MGQVLAVTAFGGGVALEGSSDAKRTDELAACDGYDLGARGQLIAASDLSNVASVLDGSGAAMTHMLGIGQFRIPTTPYIVVVGDNGVDTFAVRTLNANDGTSANSQTIASSAGTIAAGSIVTTLMNVGAYTPGYRIALINIGARATTYPRGAPGLYVLAVSPGGVITMNPVSIFDALGTGSASEDVAAGTHGKQLYFRGIVGYNGHCFGWGFFDADATNGEQANRLMFSNIGDFTKYGNDPGPVGTDRAFVDSDAIAIGSLGSIIRAAYTWAGRLWVGCNDGLYYVEGFGRDSFKTNGVIPISTAKHVIGPGAMIEGPDQKLYGVSDQGLWSLDDNDEHILGNRLREFSAKSIGYWDLIWSDPTQSIGAYPGRTNQDLVWMLSDPATMQVWVVIPFCDATAGYGKGTDTVIVKYSTVTGGFTRQVFAGQTLTAGTVWRRDASAIARRFILSPGASTNLRAYAQQLTPNASPILPAALPDVTFGEYAPFGPDGVGVMRKRYLTLAWESAASTLGLVYSLTPTVDGETLAAVKLSIQPTAPGTPADGDLWLDTSGTDTNLGNGTAGAIVTAHAADFLFKRWKTTWNKWVQVPGAGQQGRRATLPIAFDYARGTRFTVRCLCTAADRRFQVEGFSEKPGIIREAA